MTLIPLPFWVLGLRTWTDAFWRTKFNPWQSPTLLSSCLRTCDLAVCGHGHIVRWGLGIWVKWEPRTWIHNLDLLGLKTWVVNAISWNESSWVIYSCLPICKRNRRTRVPLVHRPLPGAITSDLGSQTHIPPSTLPGPCPSFQGNETCAGGRSLETGKVTKPRLFILELGIWMLQQSQMFWLCRKSSHKAAWSHSNPCLFQPAASVLHLNGWVQAGMSERALPLGEVQ